MPASALFMGAAWSRKVLALAVLGTGVMGLTVGGEVGSYQLGVEYHGENFFDGFQFFTAPDPTHGFVNYVDYETALAEGLIAVSPMGTAYIGVDHQTVLDPNGVGRDSVRIQSKQTYTHGLIITDLANMPGQICGTWPAHWSYGPNWPANGEIDIIEGVNSQSKNLMSLHTSPGCSISGTGGTGTLQTSNCDSSVNYNSGCGVLDSSPASYGSGFNKPYGGVYATEWTSDYIRIWFFPAASVPLDIQQGFPDPSKWGTPDTNFEGACDIDNHFANHQLVFDTTFCGDWASAAWSTDSTCGSKAPTCNEYVALNPGAFKDAYWAINSMKVYHFVPTPILKQTVGAYSYFGCQTEAGETGGFRTLDGPSKYDPAMTLESCAAFCVGYTYFGTENANECYCGDYIHPVSLPEGDGNCYFSCAGNDLEYCGAGNLISMFRLTGAPPDPLQSSSSSSASSTSTSSSSTWSSTSSSSTSTFTSATPTSSSSTSTSTSLTPSSTSSTSSSSRSTPTSSTSTSTSTSATPSSTSSTSSSSSSTSISSSSNPTPSSFSSTSTNTTPSSTRSISSSSSSTSSSSSSIPNAITSTPSVQPTISSTSAHPSHTPPSSSSTPETVLPTSTSSVHPSSSSVDPMSSTIPSPPSSSSVAPAPSAASDPLTISDFELLGCYSDPSGFPTFTQVENSPSMTLERCIGDCGAQKYAGIFNTQCFCAETLGATPEQSFSGNCNTPCPGNPKQSCGGSPAIPRRGLASSQLLTIYVSPNVVVGSSSSSSSVPVSTVSSTAPGSTSSSSSYAPPMSMSSSTQSNSQASYSTSSPASYSGPPSPTTYSTPSSTTPCSTTVITTSSISTVYSTSIYTITSCAPSITNCPARLGSVTTDTILLYTTICPVTLTQTRTGSAYPISTPKPQSSVMKYIPGTQAIYTTVLTTSYVDVCPQSTLSTYQFTSTQTLTLNPTCSTTPSAWIPMTTTTKAALISGSTSLCTVTVPITYSANSAVKSGPVGNVYGYGAVPTSSSASCSTTATIYAAASPIVNVVTLIPVPTGPLYPYPIGVGNATATVKMGGVASPSVGGPQYTGVMTAGAARGSVSLVGAVVGVLVMILAM